jgi:hypothetical protein
MRCLCPGRPGSSRCRLQARKPKRAEPPATRWGPESPQQPPPLSQRRREIAGGRQPFGSFVLAERGICAIPYAGAENQQFLPAVGQGRGSRSLHAARLGSSLAICAVISAASTCRSRRRLRRKTPGPSFVSLPEMTFAILAMWCLGWGTVAVAGLRSPFKN